MSEDSLKPETQNLTQLAKAYGVSNTTLKKWLVKVGILQEGQKRKVRLFTPAEVKTIYEKLGEP